MNKKLKIVLCSIFLYPLFTLLAMAAGLASLFSTIAMSWRSLYYTIKEAWESDKIDQGVFGYIMDTATQRALLERHTKT